MNARERFIAVMNFERVDRSLLWEVGYWGNTMRRWYAEGLPRRHGLPESVPDGQVVAGEAFPWDATKPPETSPRALSTSN